VLATARDAATVGDLAELGIETLSLVVDDPESVKASFADVETRLGDKGLDYLVNNAWVSILLLLEYNYMANFG